MKKRYAIVVYELVYNSLLNRWLNKFNILDDLYEVIVSEQFWTESEMLNYGRKYEGTVLKVEYTKDLEEYHPAIILSYCQDILRTLEEDESGFSNPSSVSALRRELEIRYGIEENYLNW